jgi:hypothetical protein
VHLEYGNWQHTGTYFNHLIIMQILGLLISGSTTVCAVCGGSVSDAKSLHKHTVTRKSEFDEGKHHIQTHEFYFDFFSLFRFHSP